MGYCVKYNILDEKQQDVKRGGNIYMKKKTKKDLGKKKKARGEAIRPGKANGSGVSWGEAEHESAPFSPIQPRFPVG